ncbi:hypothetical protein SCHPADRAFT_201850 [Schizopora paradoxa]|uniref:Uncharacterized protein n=1 Tax=Schizopora paradoxa TaxID=27342 RepID=A0A0H2RX53_9AGAM|nr:hypothetical protein SCHPADRAFT_201850 [Schizopora paradoxa]
MSHTQEVHQPEMQQHQPGATPSMTPQKQKTSESIPKSYMTGVAKEAGKETVEHLSQSQDFQQTANNLEQNAEQKYDDAKWCGCLGSV